MKLIIVILVVLALVIGLVAFDIIDVEETIGWTRNIFYRGSGAAQRFVSTDVKDVERAQLCRENLKKIEAAKRRLAQQRSLAPDTIFTWDELKNFMGWQAIPRCPDGGVYEINPLGILPICSVGTNGTPDNQDDHIIHNW